MHTEYAIAFRAPDGVVTFLSPDTQVRRAIRRARKELAPREPGTQVTVRAFSDELPAKGRVEYQAHIGADGKIHIEER